MSEGFARFWKCALQVNPFTYAKEYQGKGSAHGLSESDYNEAITARCIKNGIQVVGLADHGSVEGVDKLRSVLEAKGILVLPGFEISSTEKVHLVCLYPNGTSVGSLNQYMGALGLSPGAAKTAPSSLACLAIAKLVLQQGGFWYAAHVTGSNGLLRLNQDGGGLTHIWCSCDEVMAAQIPADVDSIPDPAIQNILKNKNADYKRTRRIALLNSKDVKKPEDLDNPRSCSWIKMTAPTLDALRLACRDPESRVRLSHEVNPAYYSRIERVAIHRGYLEELTLELSPNLNAVVGGRGTGKSTLVEGLRYALDLPAASKEAKAAHDGIVNANFAKEKAGIEITVTSFSQNSERYVISRYFGEPAKVLDEDGQVLKLSPRDVLPKIEVYGQNELLAIVRDERAKGALLGRFLPDDSAVRGELNQLVFELRKNRQEIDDLETKIAEILGRLEQLPALLDREKSFKKLGLEAELAQVKQRETQRAFTGECGETLEALSQLVDEFQSSIDDLDLPETPEDGLPEALKPFLKIVSNAKTEVAKAAAEASAATETASSSYTNAKEAFDANIATGEHAFNAAVNKMPALKGKTAAQLTEEYKKVSAAIAKLTPLSSQKTGLQTKLVGLNKTRANLLQRLSTARNTRWTGLSKSVKELNKRLDGQLRVDFEPGRLRSPLKEFLLNAGLEGVGEKRLAWIDEAEGLSIPDLVGAIRDGSDAVVKKFKAAGMSKQVADALSNLPAPALRALEEIELPERLELLLNLALDGDSYREVAKLSTGQQCTAILHLLLLDNRDPLIIDQPEDNLDNAFIADHIVNELRASKTKRQFLFATHNANIPVFGDAEWIGVLQEQDGRAILRASGSIDAPDVKELAANILEGGKEAFTRRREKYGL